MCGCLLCYIYSCTSVFLSKKWVLRREWEWRDRNINHPTLLERSLPSLILISGSMLGTFKNVDSTRSYMNINKWIKQTLSALFANHSEIISEVTQNLQALGNVKTLSKRGYFLVFKSSEIKALS